MPISTPFVLDFSRSDINKFIQKNLEKESIPHFFEAALIFSMSWLNGNKEFDFSTSGSTGIPKVISVSKKRIVASIESTARFFDLKTGNKVFICLNPEFTGGKMMLARAIHLGLEAHIVSPSNLDFTLRDSFALASFVPNQLYSIFQSENSKDYVSNFKNILVGGAPVNEEMKREIQKVVNSNIYETFGMTETLSHIALKRLNYANASSSFEILMGVEIKTNEKECLMIRSLMTENEWIETKDIVEIQDSTHFRWRGRLDNMVNSGGIKIYPEEIEKLIAPILASANFHVDFFLTSLHNERLGEKLVLVLEGEGFPTENLIATLKSQLPKFHSPSTILFKSHFERTASGKIIRNL